MRRELKPFSILFIEDEESILKKFVKYLSNRFKNVYGTTNAEDALEIYADKKPDIMMVDIHLPKMNGLEFIDIIRQKDLSTKIIILTAYNEIDYLLSATSLKLIDYLVKPIKRDTLNKSLLKAIDEIKNFNIQPQKKFFT